MDHRARGYWVANLPEVKNGQWSFVQLLRMISGAIAADAAGRLLQHRDTIEPSEKSKGKGFDRFKFSGDNIRGIGRIFPTSRYLAFRSGPWPGCGLSRWMEASKVVTFTGPTRHLEGWSALSKGRRFLVENVREALHRPGEWYLDRKTGDLIYIPCRRRSAAHGNGRAAHRHARADSGRAGQRQLLSTTSSCAA